MANFQRIFGEDGLPYRIDTSGEGVNESYSPWSMGNDDLELRSEPPAFSRSIDMDFGYGQDMARFREFQPSHSEPVGVISDPGELAKSDFLRAEKAGYQDGDFDRRYVSKARDTMTALFKREYGYTPSANELIQYANLNGMSSPHQLSLNRVITSPGIDRLHQTQVSKDQVNDYWKQNDVFNERKRMAVRDDPLISWAHINGTQEERLADRNYLEAMRAADRRPTMENARRLGLYSSIDSTPAPSKRWHPEVMPTSDPGSGFANGGTEIVAVSDEPPIGYRNEIRNAVNASGQFVNGVGRGAVNGTPKLLASAVNGWGYIGAGLYDQFLGGPQSNRLGQAFEFCKKYDGELLPYDSDLSRWGGHIGEFLSPAISAKALTLGNEVNNQLRIASTAARDWKYGAMERQMLNDAGLGRPALADASIPSSDELNYLAKSTLDFSSKPNGAVFWSGGNMNHAQRFGRMTGKTTLEQTSGGRYLDDLKLFPVRPKKGANVSAEDLIRSKMAAKDAAKVFDAASARFAQEAKGNVNAFTFGAKRMGPYGERTWWRIEQPILGNQNPDFPNPNINAIRQWRFPWELEQ